VVGKRVCEVRATKDIPARRRSKNSAEAVVRLAPLVVRAQLSPAPHSPASLSPASLSPASLSAPVSPAELSPVPHSPVRVPLGLTELLGLESKAAPQLTAESYAPQAMTAQMYQSPLGAPEVVGLLGCTSADWAAACRVDSAYTE